MYNERENEEIENVSLKQKPLLPHHSILSEFALREKLRFSLLKNRDFVLNANALNIDIRISLFQNLSTNVTVELILSPDLFQNI